MDLEVKSVRERQNLLYKFTNLCNLKKNELIHTETILTVARGRGRKMNEAGQKPQTSSYKISSRDVMESMRTLVILLYKLLLN